MIRYAIAWFLLLLACVDCEAGNYKAVPLELTAAFILWAWSQVRPTYGRKA